MNGTKRERTASYEVRIVGPEPAIRVNGRWVRLPDEFVPYLQRYGRIEHGGVDEHDLYFKGTISRSGLEWAVEDAVRDGVFFGFGAKALEEILGHPVPQSPEEVKE